MAQSTNSDNPIAENEGLLPIFKRPKDDKEDTPSKPDGIPMSNDGPSTLSNGEDILKKIENEKGTLCDVEEEHFGEEKVMVERVRFILNLYSLWITNHQQQRHKELNHGLRLRDMISERLSESYDYNRFLADYRRISGIKRDFVGDDKRGCDVECCAVIGRNERNRGFYGKNESMRNQLYFIEGGQSVDDDDAVAKDIATQQILDSLHTYFYHSVHLNDEERKEVEDQDDEMEDDIDFDTLCDDYLAEKLVNLLEEKRNGSNRFRSRQRGKSDKNEKEEKSNENAKFMTTNEFTAASNSSFDAVYAKKRQRTFRDVFVSEMKRIGISDDAIRSFNKLADRQQFDSDAMICDLGDSDDSNLTEPMSDDDEMKKFRDIAKRLILDKKLKASLYSPGVRYFYWEKYRNNKEKRRMFWKGYSHPVYEENRGYALGQWFVEKKYGNLKDEILNNLVHTLSARQFTTTVQKAKDKLSERRISGKAPLCRESWWEETYGIKQKEQISEEHIIAILLYTNFSELCYLFSATYRTTHEYEEDEDMMARHREFGNWGRLLREAVECFGTGMEYSNIRTFFHGVSDTLVFNSTSVHLCGPVSTTSSFHIASTIFGSGGLVLSIRKTINPHCIYFDCTPWSDFVDEDEKLFIGGLCHLDFLTIRNMSTTPTQNYKLYIQAMTRFHYIIEGWGTEGLDIKKGHAKSLELLINEEINGKWAMSSDSNSVVPRYVLLLWHHFLGTITELEIDWYLFVHKTTQCYSHLVPVLTNENGSELNLDEFVRILPNIRSIQICNAGRRKDPSFPLDLSLKNKLLSAVKYINENNGVCNVIAVVRPIGDLDEFIEDNNADFQDNGWNLVKKPFASVFHPHYPTHPDTLCVQRLQ